MQIVEKYGQKTVTQKILDERVSLVLRDVALQPKPTPSYTANKSPPTNENHQTNRSPALNKPRVLRNCDDLLLAKEVHSMRMKELQLQAQIVKDICFRSPAGSTL